MGIKKFTSQERTRNYVFQIKGAFVFKVLAVAVSFVAIPLMIRYLGVEKFGVWSTLLSIISWILFFDLGIGNGLRNKLAESLAKDEIGEAVNYISSGYSLIGIAAIVIYVFIVIFSFILPWQLIFNTHAISESILRNAILVAAFFIVLNFWLGLILQVSNAVQITSVGQIGQFGSNIIALMILVVLIHTSSASILLLAAGYGVSLVVSNLAISYWFFKRHGELIPKFYLNKLHVRPLLSVGIKFFVIQMAVLIIYTTDKMLIIQLLGPKSVTEYEIVFKLFSAISIAYSLVTAPLWSACTEAYHRGDLAWIRGMILNQLRIFILVCLAISVLILAADKIIFLWIGNDFNVSPSLVISMGFFVLITAWNSIFSYVVNGLGETKVSMTCAVIGMIINIPLAILGTTYYKLGVSGVVLGACISQLLFSVAGPIHVYLLLNKKPSFI